MKAKLGYVVWMLAVAAQFGVVAAMIGGREATLRDGVLYRFRTAPVDPYDAFRGRYVALSVAPSEAPWAGVGERPRRNRAAYVALGTDEQGVATLLYASDQPPATGDYVRARVTWHREAQMVGVQLPFDRYYLSEDEAPRAETLYREHSGRGGARDAEVLVRVRGGDAVIEDLLIAGRPVRDWLTEEDAP